jgi:hypothetical protein
LTIPYYLDTVTTMIAKPKSTVQRVSLSLPAEQIEWLQEMAWRKRQPLSHYVRDMVACWISSAETAFPSDPEAMIVEFPGKTDT